MFQFQTPHLLICDRRSFLENVGLDRIRIDLERKKMVTWRAAGINYVRFAQIASEVTRKCTKTTAKPSAKITDRMGNLKVIQICQSC
ncbi:hypothetical protein KIN20_029291 [Parelaphostrongylus tenuis]|uniref:Uncharacterized protein n=1 Tax=Parelaphostrongylus tenuis TaxID=148309 RepID=A0AAD5WFH9_PARTN|nr:hypothetical protein KIN20_029291 [Parelaphostrongylus tenuis]